MKQRKQKKRLKAASRIVTVALFVVAVAMLLGGSIGGTRAALTYYSETYTSRIQMYDIGVSLVENDREVSWRDYSSAGDGTWNEQTGVLLENMIPEGEKLTLGKKYTEELKVRNTGTINEYVRVSIYKYWLDPKGVKMRDLSPDLIDEKVASMSCKAAVKGNMKLTASEVDALIGELLTLENPYHCPHGRPTIIAMSRRELEKKFKRIV